jgi:methylenetetrahydrofolate dehydrogenase (NADP+)/methenyltetrahydrofolate cyclohydrolase
MSNIIDGKALAYDVCEQVKQEISLLKQKHNITPTLAVILVGEDPASEVYVNNKDKKAAYLGINSLKINLPSDTTQEELIKKIEDLNADAHVNGILVQLPLPEHIDKEKIITTIKPEKDVDGFHIENIGKLYTQQKDAMVPCTPLGCLIMLKRTFNNNLSGLHAVIVGRSNIVGKPMAELLLQENCTVTITHSKTQNIEAVCKQADIIVAAVGRPLMVKENWVKDGAVIIDVGINRILQDGKNKLVGDVDFANIQAKAKAITPVPGGVGPMTIACLMQNTLKATKTQNNL